MVLLVVVINGLVFSFGWSVNGVILFVVMVSVIGIFLFVVGDVVVLIVGGLFLL